jgi:hypothetical protein
MGTNPVIEDFPHICAKDPVRGDRCTLVNCTQQIHELRRSQHWPRELLHGRGDRANRHEIEHRACSVM